MTVKGMLLSDSCRFCHGHMSNVEPFLCNFCRGKIFKWINQHGWTLVQTEKPTGEIGEYIRDIEKKSMESEESGT